MQATQAEHRVSAEHESSPNAPPPCSGPLVTFTSMSIIFIRPYCRMFRRLPDQGYRHHRHLPSCHRRLPLPSSACFDSSLPACVRMQGCRDRADLGSPGRVR